MTAKKEGTQSPSPTETTLPTRRAGSISTLTKVLASELNVPMRTANRVVYGVLDSIVLELRQRGKLRLKGYATLTLRPVSQRTYPHPRSGKGTTSKRTHRLVTRLAKRLAEEQHGAESVKPVGD